LTHCITQAGFPDPHDPSNPPPEPKKTRTRESGLGFHRVRVGVALKPPWGDPCQSLVITALTFLCYINELGIHPDQVTQRSDIIIRHCVYC